MEDDVMNSGGRMYRVGAEREVVELMGTWCSCVKF